MVKIDNINGLSLYKKHGMKIRFVVVGVWNTLLGYGVFVLFDVLFSGIFETRYMAYMTANVLSNVIAVLNAYIFHKFVTFRIRTKGRSAIVEFFRFSLTYVGTFLLSILLLPLCVEFIGLNPRLAAAVIILICVIVSYVGHSRFSFRKAEAETAQTRQKR